MLALRYPQHEVVVVDDGSHRRHRSSPGRRPSTWSRSPARSRTTCPPGPAVIDVLVPRDGRTRLVRRAQGRTRGRSEAINVGINAARYPLVAIVDADSILDPTRCSGVTKPFADDPTRMVATGGAIRAVNGCRVVPGAWSRSRCRRPGWPGSRSWSTCARSCSAAPAGPGSAP